MIGIVADDITGANDIGIMFAKSYYTTDVYRWESEQASLDALSDHPDVLILDTNSRFDPYNVAYDKVYQATKQLQSVGVTQYYNKTCSVFRGNIGAEFDAMLDALGEDFAIIVLGFPKNGRITKKGLHYVHGRLLEQSEFREDPVHPMTESNLVDILQAQTKRKVGSISFDVVEKGADTLRQTIEQFKETYQYVIVDVTDQEDLYTIAQAVYQEKVIAGSSALAEELPKVIGKRSEQTMNMIGDLYDPSKGLLCTAGSLMPQTLEQIEYMRHRGTCVIEMDSLALLDDQQRGEVQRRLISACVTEMNQGKDVVLHSTNDQEKVKKTKHEAARKGISNSEISQLVSRTLSEITVAVMNNTGQKSFVIAGGDTSAAACRALGIKSMRVWREIQPGLPSCFSLSPCPMHFVLKSGSFGDVDFIERAFQHLKKDIQKDQGAHRS
ncbi:uncharacterized protein YgbK (DUF1537 family) [Pullulanibacillus pueri]|uniref:HPr kinase n=1 Tax=Pullulanibacillus pueri TaxID=1437324 RepID=A0A8J2ZY36_9BACL|nr:four-carbon acid sugar kinase family protein [Pullulanibacillus pueri]MBM7682912.1 uncharacterized protein YgbK (DUF1537 family) [Pullulanibacillus pueri]GGH84809.1 HPr kinase [Pullulanibacillus pueri]